MLLYYLLLEQSIQFQIIIIIKPLEMNIKVDDLISFCSYYALNRVAATLPHFVSGTTNKQPQERSKHNNERPVRQKVEDYKPKKTEKVVKAKIQHPSKSPQKSRSPIHSNVLQEPKRQQSTNYDINYFMSHMTGHPYESNNLPRSKQFQVAKLSRTHQGNNMQNYQTFGRSHLQPPEYQTFQDKLRKDNQHTARTEYFRTESKPNYGFEHSPWLHSQQTQKNASRSFIQFDLKKSYYGAPTFDKINAFQPTESKLTYSPQRSNTLKNSWIRGTSPDDTMNQLSKSRNRHSNKKTERPLYDASKLVIQKEKPQLRPKQTKGRQFSQTYSLTQSCIYTDVLQSPENRASEDTLKRQTSTTAPPLRNNERNRKDQRKERNETDLDDALGQTLTQLSSRKAPVAFDLKLNS